MKLKTAAPEYIERALALSKEDAERLFSRMRGKLHRRLDAEKIRSLEAVALQLQLEDEQLKEWRDNLDGLRKSAKHKADGVALGRRDS